MFKIRKKISLLSVCFLLSVSLPISITHAESTDYIEEIISNIDEELVREYTQDLVNFGPKVTGSEACIQAEDYIFEEFQNSGLRTEFLPWINGEFEGRNIEAILPGESEKSFIICAHLDTVDGSPGADDDCTGVAAVLAAAKTINENKGETVFAHTIRFVIFTGAEQMFKGSYIYVTDAIEKGLEIGGVIEAHLLGYIGDSDDGNTNMNIARSKYFSDWIADVAENTAENYIDLIDLTINRQTATGYFGDRYPFDISSIGFTFFSAFYFNTNVHSSEDTIDKLDFDYTARMTRLIVATMIQITNNDFENQPPDKPLPPTGPSSGKPEIEYNFTAITADYEDNQVFYKWDWGDGTYSDWLGPYYTYSSGQTCKISYSWAETGDFEVKVKAKDIHGVESDWSDPSPITMPKNKIINEYNILLLRLIQRFPILEYLL